MASAAGFLFFGCNFGEEAGAATEVWVLRACIVQGLQQVWGAFTRLRLGGNLTDDLVLSLCPLVLGLDDGWTGSGYIHHSGLHHLRSLASVGHVHHLLLPHVLWIARLLPSGEPRNVNICHWSLTRFNPGPSVCSQLLQDSVQEEAGDLVHGRRDSS